MELRGHNSVERRGNEASLNPLPPVGLGELQPDGESLNHHARWLEVSGSQVSRLVV